jgi:hypothetical protein
VDGRQVGVADLEDVNLDGVGGGGDTKVELILFLCQSSLSPPQKGLGLLQALARLLVAAVDGSTLRPGGHLSAI